MVQGEGKNPDKTKVPVPKVPVPKVPVPKVPKRKRKSFLDAFQKVSRIDVILSIRHLSLMLKSGISLGEGVEILSHQATSKRLEATYEQIQKDVQGGLTLAASMEKHGNVFPSVVTAIVSVGEQAGTLEKNLVFLADYLKKEYELQRKVKGAMLYPLIVFAITVSEMLGMIFFILPRMEELFKSFENVPAFTQVVLDITTFIRGNVIMFLVFGTLSVIAWVVFSRTSTGKSFKDRGILMIPIFKSMARKNLLASFSRTLGILLESGIPITKALKISSETIGNEVYAKALRDVYGSIKTGRNLAVSLRKHEKLFPGTLLKMIEAGEKTGTLEENLAFAYDYYSSEVEDMANNLTNLLEPILLVVAGLMIGILALTIIAPIYQLTSAISQ